MQIACIICVFQYNKNHDKRRKKGDRVYLIYPLLIVFLLQSLLLRIPGLLLIVVVLYAVYSFVQYRRTRKAYSGGYQEPQGNTGSASHASHSHKQKDVIDVEYTEHEL